MSSNPRLLIRSLHNVTIKNNLIMGFFVQLKKIIGIYSDFPQKSFRINRSIKENKAKLLKTKQVIDFNAQKSKYTSINLIR